MPTSSAVRAVLLGHLGPIRAGLLLYLGAALPPLTAADKEAVVLAFSPNFWNNAAIWTPAGEPNAGDNVFLGPAIDTASLDLKNIPIFYASSRPDDTILGLLRISAPLYGGVTTGIINVGFVGSVPVIEPPLFYSRGVHQAGSTLRTTNEIIGDDQTGYFLQTGGLHTVENDVTLGWKAGSEGHYLLNAPVDGTFRVRRDLIVGDAGRGLFQKTSGTAIVQRDLWFGRGTGSNGVGMLSGQVDIWGNLTIGGSGVGAVFANTNPLSVGGDLYLGRSAGSQGSLSMSATAATLVAGNVIIGGGGRGDIVQTGVPSLLQATGSIIVAQDPGSEGKLDSLLGAGVVAGLDLVVGDGGMGVGVNSTIPQVGRDLIIGRSAGGEGGYITTGNLLIGRDLMVGGGGKGAYTQNGPMEVVGNVLVGVEASGSGLIKSITPLWDLGGTLRVGLAGKGEVIMTGKVDATGTVTVGEQIGSEGYLAIEGLLAPPGAETGLVAGGLHVGIRGKGEVLLTDSILNTASGIIIGQEATGQGTVTLNAGLVGLTTPSLTVGLRGTGDLKLDFSRGEVWGDVQVGAEGGSRGTLNLDISTLTVGGNLHLGASGWGEVLVGPARDLRLGSELTVTGNMMIGAGTSSGVGTLSMDAGTRTRVTGDTVVGGSGTAALTYTGMEFATRSLTVGPGAAVSFSGTNADPYNPQAFGKVSLGTVNQSGGALGFGAGTELTLIHTDAMPTGFQAKSYALAGGTLTAPTLRLAGGTLSQTGGNLITGNLILESGTLAGVVHSSGTLTVAPTFATTAAGLRSGGTFALTHALTVSGGFESAGSTVIAAGGSLLTNPFKVSGGTTTVQSGGRIESSGASAVSGGALTLQTGSELQSASLAQSGGMIDVQSGAKFTVSNLLSLTGGTLTLGSGSTVALNQLNISSNTPDAASHFVLNRDWQVDAPRSTTWSSDFTGASASRISGSGTLTNATGASFTITGTGEKRLDLALVNQGTLTWSRGQVQGTGTLQNQGQFTVTAGAPYAPAGAFTDSWLAPIVNHATGTITLTRTDTEPHRYLFGALTNQGTINTTNVGAVSFDGPYTGNGALVGPGIAQFRGGGSTAGLLNTHAVDVSGSGTTFTIQHPATALPVRNDIGFVFPTGTVSVGGGATLRLETPAGQPYTFTRYAGLGTGILDTPNATALNFAAGVAFGTGGTSPSAPVLPKVPLTVLAGSQAKIHALADDLTLAAGSTAALGGTPVDGHARHTANLTNHGSLQVGAAGRIDLEAGITLVAKPQLIEGGGTITNAPGGSTKVDFTLASEFGGDTPPGGLHAAGKISQKLVNQGNATVQGVAQSDFRLAWWDGLIENVATFLFERGWMDVNEFRNLSGNATLDRVGVRSSTGLAVSGGTLHAQGSLVTGNLALSGTSQLRVGTEGLVIAGTFADAPGTTTHLFGPLSASGTTLPTAFQGTLILDGAAAGLFTANLTSAATGSAPNLGGAFTTNLNGAINTVNAGATLEIRNGLSLSGGTTWTTHGTFLVGSGSTFTRTDGTLAGNGTIRVLSGGAMVLGTGGGNWSGPAGEIRIEAGGSLTLGSHNNGNHRFYDRVVTNYGTVTRNEALLGMNAGTTITNHGTWHDNSGNQFISEIGPGGGTFVNHGTFNKNLANTVGFGSGHAGPAFVNHGTLNIHAGTFAAYRASTFSGASVANLASGTTLLLRDGTNTIQDGARFLGAGTLSLGDAGSHTLTGAIHADNASFWGGTLHGTHTLTGTWNKSGSGGSMGTAGTTTIASGATWNFQASTNLRGRTFVNQGTVNRTDGQLEFSPETLIQNHGTWNDANQGNNYVSHNSPQGGLFENFGTFNKTAAGTLSFASGSGGPGFTNRGIVNVQTGTFSIHRTSTFSGTSVVNLAGGASLLLRDGTNTIQNGARFLGAGTLSFGDAGSHTLSGAIHADNASFWGGTLHGTHTLTGTWNKSGSGGNMGTTGTTTIASGATWNFQASTNLRGRTFFNQGTVNRTDGQLEFSPETLIQNHGTWNDATLGNSYASQNSPQGGVFENVGTFNKTAAGTLSFASGSGGPGFTNHGSVNVNQGTFSIHRTSTFSGTSVVNLAGGTTLLLRDGTNTIQDGARFLGPGTLAFGDAAHTTLSGHVTATNAHFGGGTLHGTHTLHGDWRITDYAGGFGSAGTTTIASDGIWRFASVWNQISNRTFVNEGQVFHTFGQLSMNSATTVRNDGTWSDSSGAPLVSTGDRAGLFENRGTFVKTGANTVEVNYYSGPVFSNLGTVDVQQGTLELHRNVAQHSGSTLTGGTWIVRSGASLHESYSTGYTINQAHVTLHGTGNYSALAGLTQNQGTLRLLDGKAFTAIASPFSNSGVLEVGIGSNFTTPSTLANSGTLKMGGTLSAVSGLSNAGLLTGTGTITGAVSSTGTIAPGGSPGLLTIAGNLSLEGTSQLLMELGGTSRGTSYDAIDVTGNLAFGGSLVVSTINGFTPVAGNSFDLFNFSTSAGTFSSITLPVLGTGLVWDTSALYTSGVLSAIPEPSTYAALAGAGALALAWWRRRRA